MVFFLGLFSMLEIKQTVKQGVVAWVLPIIVATTRDWRTFSVYGFTSSWYQNLSALSTKHLWIDSYDINMHTVHAPLDIYRYRHRDVYIQVYMSQQSLILCGPNHLSGLFSNRWCRIIDNHDCQGLQLSFIKKSFKFFLILTGFSCFNPSFLGINAASGI